MSEGHRTDSTEQKRLADLWENAVTIDCVPPDTVERAFFRGLNIRVKFPAAFIAAFEMAVASISISAAIAAPIGWPKAAFDAFRAAHSVISAMVETMMPLDYITAVVLSQHKDGLDQEHLKNEVVTFLDNPQSESFGWHLGITENLRANAHGDLYDGWSTDVLERLESGGFLTREGDLLVPRQKNVEWKFGF